MSNLGYAPGPMGWVVPGATNEREMLDGEKRYFDRALQDYPIAYQARERSELLPAIAEKWAKFQADRGRFPGSQDFTLLDEFVFGKSYTFLPQPIGSCVFSNSFRPWVAGALYQICLLGQAEEFTGREHLGPGSIAPFCVSYGFARQRANMRSGDGLYCKPMQESYLKDGIVLCSTPRVQELMRSAGATNDSDYPEPRNERLYRSIGNWAWNNDLKQYTCCRMLDAPIPRSMSEYMDNIRAGRPMFQCSGIAVRKVGRHKDGFDIHDIDPDDSWGHNMGNMGVRVSSDDDEFVIVDNTSWLPPGSRNPEAYVYNVPRERFERAWFPKIDIGVIGDIDGIQSLPALI